MWLFLLLIIDYKDIDCSMSIIALFSLFIEPNSNAQNPIFMCNVTFLSPDSPRDAGKTGL